jgi:hypothetical protein
MGVATQDLGGDATTGDGVSGGAFYDRSLRGVIQGAWVSSRNVTTGCRLRNDIHSGSALHRVH